MANTLNLGNGNWATKEDSLLAYNSENGNYKPLPFDFTRASSATVVNKAGLIETVGSGEPRIDFSNDAKGALLLEPTRSNLIIYSEDFSQSAWVKTNIAITSNNTISPDGALNGTKLNENTVSSTNFRLRGSSVVTTGANTLSIFAKASERNWIKLRENAQTGRYAFFDLKNGIVGQTNADDAIIEYYGNGWYKLSITDVLTSVALDVRIAIADGVDSYNGVIGNGVYVWGAQIEQGSYATSYIPNFGNLAGATRSADSSSQTVPSGIIGQTEGVIFLDIQMPSTIQSNTTFSIGGGTSGEYAQLEIRSDLSINWRYRQGADDYINENVGSYVGGDRLKLAFAYKNGSSVLYKNGVSIATDNGSIASNSWNNVNFSNFSGTGSLNANVNQTSLYSTRLSNAELQALTK